MTIRQSTSSVTRKGQVTIPAHIRRKLGIRANDRVEFYTEGDTICIKAVKETLDTIYGAVAPLKRPVDFDAMRDQVHDDLATGDLAEMRGEEDEAEQK